MSRALRNYGFWHWKSDVVTTRDYQRAVEDAAAEQVKLRSAKHGPLSILILFTCPSTGPEFQWRVNPSVTAA